MKILPTKSIPEDRREPADTEVTLEEFEVKPDILQMGPEGGRIPPEVEAVVQRAIGGGEPMEGALQEQMTASLGHDFSKVRIHISPEADELCRQLSARAFTIGSDIFFQRGAYSPTSLSGRRLIAHELVHVMQQRAGEVTGDEGYMIVCPADDIFEQNADAIATQVVANGRWNRGTSAFRADSSRSLTIQRTSAQLVAQARIVPPLAVAPNLFGPLTCHEFVLGCLLPAEGFQPNQWQLLRRIANTFVGPGNTLAVWIARYIYQPRHLLTQADVTNAGGVRTPGDGDILYTANFGSNNIQHSMIVVQGAAAIAGPVLPGGAPLGNAPTLIRGFNNAGTFNIPGMAGPPALPGQYDNNNRDVTAANLWHAAGIYQRFGAPPGLCLYLVRYQDAAANLNRVLNHWIFGGGALGPGWHHQPLIGPCPHSCPR